MSEPARVEALVVRAAEVDDMAAITAIYADAVEHGTGTFEIDPPSIVEMADRLARVVAGGLPYLVATDCGRVVGFAYASAYHARAAYRFTVEDSIYVAASGRRRGGGRALLSTLVERAAATGARQMVAVIGDSGNVASIRLHERAGFIHAGRLGSTGWKAGRWLDTVLMQRALGPGGTWPPDGAAT